MFSCASPENEAMMRKARSTRSSITLSDATGPSGASIAALRSVNARHASGERRSRMTEAAERAEVTSRGNEPSRSRRVRTASAIRAGFAVGISLGPALQDSRIAATCAVISAAASPVSVMRLMSARTRRSVASARST